MKAAWLIVLGFVALPVQATSVIMDFESLYDSGESQNYSNTDEGNFYVEEGMRIVDVDGEYSLSTWVGDAQGFTGSTAMFNNSRNATTRLEVVGGGSFDLVSIDLAPLHISFNPLEPVADPADNVYVTFVTNTGHSQTFDVGITDANWVYDDYWEVWYTDAAPPVTTFMFDAGFLGVTSVSWLQEDPGLHQFDNVRVSNVIPLPATVWLFMSALAGLGAHRKLRR